MLKLLADENFNNNIVRGLLRRNVDLDIVRVQDVGLIGVDDPQFLSELHNSNEFYLHIMLRLSHTLLLVNCSLENEWEGQVQYLPLR